MSGRLERSPGYRRLQKMGEPSPSGNTRGSFAYDEATMQTLINKWVALADRYANSARRMTPGQIPGPGLDIASESQAEAATNSAKAYYGYLIKNYTYCVRQSGILQDVLNSYRGTEDEAVTEISNSGPQAGI